MSNSAKLARLGFAVAALLLAALPAFGQGLTINQLGAGSTLTGTELLPMYQGGNPAVTTTPSAIATYVLNHSSAQSANTVFAGPTGGSSAAPSMRALVGADLPTPTTSSLGGVEAINSLSNNWIAYIDSSGVPHQSQPAIGNISGWGTNVASALGNALNGSGGLIGYSGNLGTPTAVTLTNATGLPISTGVSGLGTNVASALGNAVNATGGVVGVATGCTSWTPTDQSGAGLTFTNVNAQYCQYGNILFVYGSLTYPSTTNSSQASISLPVAVPNQTYAKMQGAIFGAGAVVFFVSIPNTSTGLFYNGAQVATTNSGLSTKTISFMLIYPAS